MDDAEGNAQSEALAFMIGYFARYLGERRANPQDDIMTELALSPSVRTSELAMQLGVSAETVRRDIEELTRRGLVSRTYGGATGLQLGLQPGFQDRDATAVQERDAIARMAVQMVKPGDVLMIDSGSTTAHFARALASRFRT